MVGKRGQYSNDLGLLPTSVTHEAQGTTATLGDVTVEINNSHDYSYVKTSKPNLNNNFVYYQDHSVNYPGEMHCEALQENDRAAKVCKSQGGEKIAGHITEGYDTYVIKGVGDGIPFNISQILAHAGVGWQQCDEYPCEKECTRDTTSGYSCNGTYNENGSYTEMVCSTTRNNQQACHKVTYDENGNKVKQVSCEVGDGITCRQVGETVYDENGRPVSTQTGVCTSWDDDGNCTAHEYGNYYRYDEDGNMIFYSYCYQWDSEGNCTNERNGAAMAYDEEGRLIAYASCAPNTNSSNGHCRSYFGNFSQTYGYDDDGNMTSYRVCNANNAGGCGSYNTNEWNYDWTYDEEGRRISQRRCKTDNHGVCSTYDVNDYYSFNADYIYDANGNMTVRDCKTIGAGGACAEYANKGAYYTLDENGNRTSKRSCTAYDSSGNCTNYATNGWTYTYDENGNRTSVRKCQTFDSNGNCTRYQTSGNYDYDYDANGKQISYRQCSGINTATGQCTGYNYEREQTYDELGNLTMQHNCTSWDGMMCSSWGQSYYRQGAEPSAPLPYDDFVF